MMSSGRKSSGGGQSSLGYLFGSTELGQQGNDQSPKVASASAAPVCKPPYGTDDVEEKTPEKAPTPPSTAKKDDGSPSSSTEYIYHRVDGENSRDVLMTGRPSTKVNSVPGGDSSLGYLFGDK